MSVFDTWNLQEYQDIKLRPESILHSVIRFLYYSNLLWINAPPLQNCTQNSEERAGNNT